VPGRWCDPGLRGAGLSMRWWSAPVRPAAIPRWCSPGPVARVAPLVTSLAFPPRYALPGTLVVDPAGVQILGGICGLRFPRTRARGALICFAQSVPVRADGAGPAPLSTGNSYPGFTDHRCRARAVTRCARPAPRGAARVPVRARITGVETGPGRPGGCGRSPADGRACRRGPSSPRTVRWSRSPPDVRMRLGDGAKALWGFRDPPPMCRPRFRLAAAWSCSNASPWASTRGTAGCFPGGRTPQANVGHRGGPGPRTRRQAPHAGGDLARLVALLRPSWWT